MPLKLPLVQGTSKDFPIQIPNSDGTPAINVFENSDTLTCNLWLGLDQPVVFNPAITWYLGNPSSGQIQISFNNTDTATMTPGNYRIQAYATRSGRTVCIADGELNLLYSPGSAETLPVYCTLQDMLRYCRWLPTVSVLKVDETGFLSQRNEARQWIENVIQRHYRLTAGLNLTLFGNPVPTWGPRRTGGYSRWLQQQLDQNFLMIDPPRRVKEICSKYAIFLTLNDIIAGNGTKDNFYQEKALWFLNECNDMTKCMTFELDLNGDGYAEVTIESALVDVLRGG